MKIAIEIAWNRVVRDCEVHPAIVVHIHEYRSQTVIPVAISDSGALTRISERAVPVVVEQMIVFADQSQRSAHGPHPAELARARRQAVLTWNGRMVGIEL